MKVEAKRYAKTLDIAIIVPCYNEEAGLAKFYATTKDALASIDGVRFSYIFADDGSSDKTCDVIEAIASKDKGTGITLLSFSRNFGKESAILALFEAALSKGVDAVVLMDADLQDPPSLIKEMVEVYKRGSAKVVYALRTNRPNSALRNALSNAFYHLLNLISPIKLQNNTRDFRLMDISVVRALASMGEYHRFSKLMFNFVGFKSASISYEDTHKEERKSRFNFLSLFSYSLDGILSFSAVPLRMSIYLGCIIALLALIYGCYVIAQKLFFGVGVSGWASLATLISFLSGVQLVMLGIVGEYIARIYEESKGRPKYILDESRGFSSLDGQDIEQT